MVNHTSLELHLQVWDNVGKVVQYTFPIFHTRRSIMNTKLATAQIRVKNWAAIIQERNESGLSVKDYCAQHQLSWDSYYYWLRKVKEALLVESGFVEVTQPKQFPVQRSVTADPNVVRRVVLVNCHFIPLLWHIKPCEYMVYSVPVYYNACCG